MTIDNTQTGMGQDLESWSTMYLDLPVSQVGQTRVSWF